MRQRSGSQLRLRLAIIVGVSLVSCFASAQKPPGPTPPLEVYLMRQDQSDCANSDVNGNDPLRIGGTVQLLRTPDGNTSVNVAITASANTVYHFYLKCVRQLGDITTLGDGTGNAAFTFPTNQTGAVYAFDMYPEGAPLGNKFQSVQVKWP
jgi:hypothetical protein